MLNEIVSVNFTCVRKLSIFSTKVILHVWLFVISFLFSGKKKTSIFILELKATKSSFKMESIIRIESLSLCSNQTHFRAMNKSHRSMTNSLLRGINVEPNRQSEKKLSNFYLMDDN